MRIAFIVQNYPPHIGGVELHVANLAKELHRLGHEPYVLTLAPTRSIREDEGVHVITGKSHCGFADILSLPSLGSTRAISRFLEDKEIDLVSIHTRFFPMSFVGLRAAHAAEIPVIHTEHGSGFVASSNPLITAASRVVDLTMGRYILRHADRVLGVSEKVTDFVGRLSGVKADVFYNAIVPSTTTDRPDRAHHLIFVGRMVEGKGWDTFLEVCAALVDKGLEITGELIGNGPDLPHVRARVEALGLSPRIEVAGRVEPAEVRRRIVGATLLNPTVLSEGFQTTLPEVLAEGGRVVTYEVPGATMLRDLGAPVYICEERTSQAMCRDVLALLAAPSAPATPELVAPLTWPYQGERYAHMCADVLEVASRER